MTKINFSIEIDTEKESRQNTTRQIEALTDLLNAVSGQDNDSNEEPQKPKKKKASKVKEQEPKQEKQEPKEEKQEPKEEPKEDKSSSQDNEKKLVEIRAELSKVIQSGGDDVRDKCIQKLQELEAKNEQTGKYNISSLDPSKYDEFRKFLDTL